MASFCFSAFSCRFFITSSMSCLFTCIISLFLLRFASMAAKRPDIELADDGLDLALLEDMSAGSAEERVQAETGRDIIPRCQPFSGISLMPADDNVQADRGRCSLRAGISSGTSLEHGEYAD